MGVRTSKLFKDQASLTIDLPISKGKLPKPPWFFCIFFCALASRRRTPRNLFEIALWRISTWMQPCQRFSKCRSDYWSKWIELPSKYISWRKLVRLSVSLLYLLMPLLLSHLFPDIETTIRGWQITGRQSSALCFYAAKKCIFQAFMMAWDRRTKMCWVHLFAYYIHSISITRWVLLPLFILNASCYQNS